MDLNCPNCGAAVPHNLKYAKLASCPSCQVALFLEEDAVKHAGERNALAPHAARPARKIDVAPREAWCMGRCEEGIGPGK